MTKKPKHYDDDDGRVICSMDVQGMRWHDKKVRREAKAAVRHGVAGDQLTRSEFRRYTWYSLLAGFVIASTFSLTWILFVLFCTEIWFK